MLSSNNIGLPTNIPCYQVAVISKTSDDPTPTNSTERPCIYVTVRDVTLASAKDYPRACAALAASTLQHIVSVVSH